jgi:acetyltransferase-like isoleucine patch superfamily enzyme
MSEAKPKLLIYGAGYTGELLATDYLNGTKNDYEVVGFIDDKKTGSLAGLPILGPKEKLPELKEKGIDNIIVSLFQDAKLRLRICSALEEIGFNFPSLAPKIPGTVNIGKGVYVRENVDFLGFHQDIGDFSVIGSYAVIEGGVKIGKGVLLSPHTFVGRDVAIGDGTVLYPHAGISPMVKIGKHCIVGPNTHLSKDLGDNRAYGCFRVTVSKSG